jgi:hypothetical protein
MKYETKLLQRYFKKVHPLTAAKISHSDKDQVSSQNSRAKGLGLSGAFTVGNWREVKRRQRLRCGFCGRKKFLTIDHIVPLSRGGTNSYCNIQALCQSCNSSKGDKTWDEYLRGFC